MFKRLTLALTLLLALVPTAQASSTFTDLDPNDPSQDAVEYMQTQAIVEGYDDGSFRSTSQINRAEFLKILIGTITETPSGENCFTDVQDQWFAPYICEAKTRGIVSGYDDGSFKPAEFINFAEASKVIAKAFELTPGLQEDGPWYQSYVEAIADNEGIPFSITDFDKHIARGEMAEVIWRLKTQPTDLLSLQYEELAGQPSQVESCQEFEALFVQGGRNDYYYYGDGFFEIEEMEAESAEDSSAASSTQEARSYSTTNLQEANVDEADTVKNNGSHLFMIDRNILRILQLYPVVDMQEVTTLDYSDQDRHLESLYLDGDTLTVLSTGYDEKQITQVDHYSIEDPSQPELTRTFEFEGHFKTSRKTNETIYLVMEKYSYNYPYPEDDQTYNDFDIENSYIPKFSDSSQSTEEMQSMATCADIHYFPRTRTLNTLITAAVPMDETSEASFELMMGNAENIYASEENLYIASTNYSDYTDFYLDWDNAKTLIHRYELSKNSIEYQTSGKIPGTLLNQFSMSEHEEHLRAATTSNPQSLDSENNLYILDKNMDITGSVEGLAEGEKIYSARMFGDRGYIVTFKEIDPLFVLNLEDPSNPFVEGELKIPGYSEYLHPFGENHLIGFGKDAEPASEEEARGRNFAWYQGVKVSLFDITDVNNPKQIASYGIGDRGTQSELLSNHKALTAYLDTEAMEGWLAFPVLLAEHQDTPKDNNAWGEQVSQGLFVLDLDLENGFTERGRISHFEEKDSYFYGEEQISRSLYIEDVLYAISNATVSAHELETLEVLDHVDVGESSDKDEWFFID